MRRPSTAEPNILLLLAFAPPVKLDRFNDLPEYSYNISVRISMPLKEGESVNMYTLTFLAPTRKSVLGRKISQ